MAIRIEKRIIKITCADHLEGGGNVSGAAKVRRDLSVRAFPVSLVSNIILFCGISAEIESENVWRSASIVTNKPKWIPDKPFSNLASVMEMDLSVFHLDTFVVDHADHPIEVRFSVSDLLGTENFCITSKFQ